MGKYPCSAILQVAASLPGLCQGGHSAHRQWETGQGCRISPWSWKLSGAIRMLPGLCQVPQPRYHPRSPPPYQGPRPDPQYLFLIPKMLKVLEILIATPEPFPALPLLPVEAGMEAPRHPVPGWPRGPKSLLPLAITQRQRSTPERRSGGDFPLYQTLPCPQGGWQIRWETGDRAGTRQPW